MNSRKRKDFYKEIMISGSHEGIRELDKTCPQNTQIYADMKTLRDYRLPPGTSFPCWKPSESPESASKAGVQVERSRTQGFDKWNYAERPTIGGSEAFRLVPRNSTLFRLVPHKYFCASTRVVQTGTKGKVLPVAEVQRSKGLKGLTRG